MTQDEKTTAHTATAGDGGERVRHVKTGGEYEVIGEGRMQTHGWEVEDTRDDADGWPNHGHYPVDMEPVTIYRSRSDGRLWVRPTAEFRDGRFETIAQAPAVQAPAGEDWQDISTCPKDSFPRLVWREDYGTCVAFVDVTGQWWPVPAFEELPTPPKLWQPLPASPWATTPTDAQPKAARPVGEEALREALKGVLFEYDRNTCAHEETHRGGSLWTICDQCGRKWADDEGGFQPYADPTAVANARKIVCELVTSHPTTGQETVATPRDGGVREARWGIEDTGDAIWVGPMRSDGRKIDRVVYFKDDLGLHRKEYVAQVKADARLIVDGVNAALSAPGSAGPGAPQIKAKERARKRIQALGAALSRRDWSETERAYEAIRDAHDRPDIYDAPLRATPSPAQEPGTGDTGALAPAVRSALVAAENALRPFASFGDPRRHFPGDHVITQGSALAKRQLQMRDCYDAADAIAFVKAALTPATTAETRDPAEGAR